MTIWGFAWAGEAEGVVARQGHVGDEPVQKLYSGSVTGDVGIDHEQYRLSIRSPYRRSDIRRVHRVRTRHQFTSRRHIIRPKRHIQRAGSLNGETRRCLR